MRIQDGQLLGTRKAKAIGKNGKKREKGTEKFKTAMEKTKLLFYFLSRLFLTALRNDLLS